MNQATDCHGRPLSQGDRVIAWWDGIRYAGTVTAVLPQDGKDGAARDILVAPDGGGAPLPSTSGNVEVTG